MQVKERHLVIIILVAVIAVCGYMWFKKTAPERKYKGEINQLKLIQQHQALDLETAKQRMELEALKKELEKNRPTYNLTPKPAPPQENP